ncbi:MAG: porin [Betaproteobacteria bacterium]|nr:porin [Betaproteobacteria bacterium]
MQKKLIALAVAGIVSAPVFAQSQVSIYGVIDQAIDVGNYGGATGSVSRLTDGAYGGSRLGFTGSEDLGNGMKANFRLEMGLRADNGTLDNASNQIFQRAATVGLSGKWGSVDLGRQYTPLFYIQAENDIFGAVGIGSLYGITNVGQTRANNSILYNSPGMNGFTAGVMYSLGDAGTAAAFQESTINPKDQGRHTSIKLRYGNGPLILGLASSSQKSMGIVAPAPVVAAKTTALFGSYDFKVVVLNAGWQTTKNDARPVTSDNRVWNVGATIPVLGNDRINLGYANRHNQLAANTDAKLLSLRYVHSMSKRTTLYGIWAKMTNENLASFSLFQAPAVGAAGYDPSTVQIGISHKF